MKENQLQGGHWEKRDDEFEKKRLPWLKPSVGGREEDSGLK